MCACILRGAGKGAGITITPFAAGHLLGGTLWRISKDDDDFVYAVDYNHRCGCQLALPQPETGMQCSTPKAGMRQ